MSAATRLRRLAAGAVALLALLGSGPAAAQDPAAVVSVDLIETFAFGAGYYAQVDIVVTSTEPFQAFDFRLEWDPSVIQWGGAFPHPAFDDDGVLFGSPELDQTVGELRDLVDLRHGAPSVGTVRIATVFLWSALGGQSVVRARGDLVTPAGERFTIAFQFPTVVFGGP